MSRRPIRLALAVAALALGFVSFLAEIAPAERSGRAGVLVTFNGSFSPSRLPRVRPVPISLTLTGSIASIDGSRPPYLGRIEVAFGAPGGLSTAGLARCPLSRLRNSTHVQALSRCRDALVGAGTMLTEVPFAPDRPVLARAKLLAFNGRIDGGRAVLVQAYSAYPPVSFVLPFHLLRLRQGFYGFLLRAPVARVLGRWPRLRSFRLTLGRRYFAGGRRHSYLKAHCPLPRRLHVGLFPLARITYRFAPRPTINTTITRACHALD